MNQQAYAMSAQQLMQQRQQQQQQQQQPQQQPQQRFAPQPMRAGAPAHAGQQAPPQANEMVQMQDGNEGFKNAKRRKPTDRSLPSFIPPKYLSTISDSSCDSPPTLKKLKPSTESLESLTASYVRLQKVERKLDWNVARRKVEVVEMGGQRVGGVKRKLRLHMTTKLVDQPWQVDLSTVKAPAPAIEVKGGESTTVEEAGKTEGQTQDEATTSTEEKKDDAASSLQPGATIPELATTVPRMEIFLTGELLGPDGKSDPKATEGKTLLNWIKRLVVDTDRDATLYDNTGPIDWRRPSSATASSDALAPGLSLSFPSSSNTRLRLSLYPDHTPTHFGLAPDLASILDMREGDRIEVLQRVWGYIGGIGGTDSGGAPGGAHGGAGGVDGKFVRADAKLKKIFGGQERIPFHHLPEYINRFLIPPPPAVIEHTVEVSSSAAAETHQAWDVDITIEDPLKAEIDKVGKNLNATTGPVADKAKEIQGIDEKIALDCLGVKSSLLKRNFLTAFAASPVNFLSQWLSSQSSDLTLILGSDRGLPSSASWREEIRRAANWEGDWVREGASLLEGRTTEAKVRELAIRAQQAQYGGQAANAINMQQQQMQMLAQQQMQQQGYARR